MRQRSAIRISATEAIPNQNHLRPPGELSGLAGTLRREVAEKISTLTAGWAGQLRRMEAYEVTFARRLADCVNEAQAAVLCKQWTDHRIDSIVSMEYQFIDLWLNSASRIASIDALQDYPSFDEE